MFQCTSLLLPECSVRREGPRPVPLRQPSYHEDFDATTLFYDIFVAADDRENNLVFIGPPLLNLFPVFCGARLGGQPLGSMPSRYYLRDRCAEVWIPNWNKKVVQLELDFGAYRLVPQAAANHLYNGRRVLFTLSRDNEVRWVVDWVQFHARNHGADAVLIYDNASAKYAGAELERSLKKTFPTLEINVVHWPYKYGPQGVSKNSGWDSDFCQAGAFQDARFRFLDSAASVLNCDIDELVVSRSAASVFAATEQSRNGCTTFSGRWVSNAVSAKPLNGSSQSILRHSSFRYVERTESCPTKWCVVPQRCTLQEQWATHVVRGKDLAACYSDAFSYRHFRGISTNWKYQRCQPIGFDSTLHGWDGVLDAAFARSGAASHRSRARGSLPQIIQRIVHSQKTKSAAPVSPAAARKDTAAGPLSLAVDPNDPALGGNVVGGDPNTFHPALWRFLVERFAVKSILDVGCGEGHCVRYCSSLGVVAFGFDGLKTNVERAVVPIALHDLRSNPFIMPVDLVLCCEVVEHIEEEYLPNLLRTLANGRVVALTHALPGQTGYHHVNCQPSSYWIEKLEESGYAFLPRENEEGKCRIRASGQWTYFVQSGLLFERR